ncbi:spore coat polysaccharide biosynthesis protein SpsF [Varunaivibrio sulfuroxidans]|uniref:Spore coat polysaccharide biosynthesis protein SpsF n=2 Tax=Varunaivibrio sulfuroxidans TaxID=1773489 RepID=A0A4R3JCX1_9PROT|nr:spore coat polysaccharide biosynthesis protein SpsF [Varunaivibrio sulfuroxidans]
MGGCAVIIQARLGSSRLPGKVLKPLAGRTVLAHVLERARAISGIDVVCCAVPEGVADDPVADEARRLGVHVFRGSEKDVLDRYVRAARELSADVVMRVTSDCPAIDPAVCGGVLAALIDRNADYASNNTPPSWPHGLDCEAVRFSWLERSAREATLPSQREHVTPYVRGHPDVRQAHYPCPVAGLAEYRWTLDTARDYDFLCALFERLPPGPEGWDYRAALAVVDANPDLRAINAGQDRYAGLKKSLAEDGKGPLGTGGPR